MLVEKKKSKKERYVLVELSDGYYDVVKESSVGERTVVRELSTSLRTSIGILIYDWGYSPCSIDCLAKKHPTLCP